MDEANTRSGPKDGGDAESVVAGAVDVPMDLARMRSSLGEDLFLATLQLQVASNRLTSALDLMLVNDQAISPESDSGYTRNLVALFAWTVSELHEMTRAIRLLQNNKADDHMEWAHDSFAALRAISSRWASKRYRTIRSKMGAHVKPDALRNGAKWLEEQQSEVIGISMSGREARHVHYAGADEILMRGTMGNSSPAGAVPGAIRIMLEAREAHGQVTRLVGDVMCDLWGLPAPCDDDRMEG